MIIETIVNVLVGFLDGLLNTASYVQIPTQGIEVLSTFTAYGTYVVGADLLLCFASVVFMWASLKLTVGVGLFIWRLLPLT